MNAGAAAAAARTDVIETRGEAGVSDIAFDCGFNDLSTSTAASAAVSGSCRRPRAGRDLKRARIATCARDARSHV
ncbi:hypothetical protein, partial [Bradyrhizobium sp.]|uniref:hypothetical protein n=1 Tax=Bradyrhizobium sp. TaxID=376 RepID=UPI0025BD62B5